MIALPFDDEAPAIGIGGGFLLTPLLIFSGIPPAVSVATVTTQVVASSASGVAGAYVATGAGCWGILCGPATGLAMSELVLDGAASSVDLAPFDPSRFR